MTFTARQKPGRARFVVLPFDARLAGKTQTIILLGAATLSGFGSAVDPVPVSGSGVLATGAATASGSGVPTTPATGSGAIALGAALVTGSGAISVPGVNGAGTITTAAATIAGAGTSRAGANMGGAVAYRLIIGQSNAVGAAGAGGITDFSAKDYSLISPPVSQLSVTSGSNNTVAFGWYDQIYLKTSADGATDPIDGAVVGPRAERAIQSAPFNTAGGCSHVFGVCYEIENGGYHVGASAVRIQKAAVFGTPITDHDPLNGVGGGNQYRNHLRAMKRATRPLVETGGSPVKAQTFVLVQGEAEVTTGQNSGLGATDPAIVNWPTIFRRVRAYLSEKINNPNVPWILHKIKPVFANQNVLDPVTQAMISAQRGLCRWSIPVASDGTVGAIVDLQATEGGSGRLDMCYVLDHSVVGMNTTNPVSNIADVHYDVPEQKLLGRAIVAAEKLIFGNTYGNMANTIAKIPPVAIVPLALSSTTSTTAVFTIQADETATLKILTVASGAAAPDAATVLAGGQSFSIVENGSTGQTTSTTATVTGLASGVSRDAYAVLQEPTYGHASQVYGPVPFTTAGAAGVTGSGTITTSPAAVTGSGGVVSPLTGSGTITTAPATVTGSGSVTASGVNGSGTITTGAATASGTGNIATPVTGSGTITTGAATANGTATVVSAPTTWDSSLVNGAKLAYSNGNKTVGRGTDQTTTTRTRSAAGRTSGKYYFETVIDAATVNMGFCTSFVSPSATGTAGVNRIGWNSGTVVCSDPANPGGTFTGTVSNSMGFGPTTVGDVAQWHVDVTNKLFWVRKNGTGNWNNNASANPATGVGGWSFLNFQSASMYAMAELVANTSAQITGRFSSSDWTYGPADSSFVQLTQ